MARAESYAYTVDDANGETLQAVDTPARVQDRIETTGAVDGQQTDSWDQYSARWTYQPEEGLTLTVWEA